MKIYENRKGEHGTSQKISKDLHYVDNTYELKPYQIFSNSSVSQLSMAVVCDVEYFHGVGMWGKGGV